MDWGDRKFGSRVVSFDVRTPLMVRLLLPLLLVASALLLVSWLLVTAAEAERDVNRDVIDKSLAVVFAVSDVKQAIVSFNANVHSILLRRTIDELNDDQASAGLAAVEQQVAETADRMRALSKTAEMPGAPELLRGVAARLDTYRDAIKVVTVLFEGDMRSAVGFLTPFDRAFEGINAQIDRTVADAENLTRRDGAAAAVRTDASIRLSYGVAAVAALASIILVILITRSIFQEIRSLGEVTERLAHGDTLVPLERFDRLSEFRPIVNGLVTFKRNLVELTFLKEIEREKELHRAAQIRAETALEELRSAQARLVETERMAALGSMVASIAHEINTPIGVSLTAITAFERNYRAIAEAMETGSLKKSQLLKFVTSSEEIVAVLVRSLHQAGDLVRSFKMVSIDNAIDERRAFDLKRYLTDALITIAPALKQSPHRLMVNLEDDVTMNSYPGALFQVVSNLVINALTHAFENRMGGTIHLTASRDGQQVELHCRDDGDGMAEDIRRKVFEPFFTTKRNRGGSGLGLSIAFRIVTEQLGGTISVTSEPGAGTDFRVVFPCTAPAAEKDLRLPAADGS